MSGGETDSFGKCGASDCKEKLFAEFEVPTYADWRALVEADLQGVPFEKKLHTKTPEGIELKPLYVKEQGNTFQCEASELRLNAAGQGTFTRARTASANTTVGWEVAQEFRLASCGEVGEAIAAEHEVPYLSAFVVLDRASRRGLDPTKAQLDEIGEDGVSFASLHDAYELLHAMRVDKSSLHFDCGTSGIETIALLTAAAYKLGIGLDQLRGSLGFSLLSNTIAGDMRYCDVENYYTLGAHLAKWCRTNAPHFVPLAVDTRVFVEAGASAVEELGFGLALIAEYMRGLMDRGLSANEAATSFIFRSGIGTNFFVEIAKFRAMRETWSKVMGAFGVSENNRAVPTHACTSRWDKSKLDLHTNMLRLTSQAFSAACGGVDVITVAPFNELCVCSSSGSDKSNSFARRIARNTQLILLEESNVHSVIDPAGGSYFVEEITSELGEKAWSLFQEVESQGGFKAAFKSGFVHGRVQTTVANRLKAVAERRDVLVGVSMYPNLSERIPVTAECGEGLRSYGNVRKQEFMQLTGKAPKGALGALRMADYDSSPLETSKLGTLVEAAVVAASAGATLGEISESLRVDVKMHSHQCAAKMLTRSRAAEGYERMRFKIAEYKKDTGKELAVFLANFGPLRQYKARADFSAAFFEPSGLRIIGTESFQSSDAAVIGTIKSGAPIVVICSTDETYPDIVPAFAKALKEQKPDIVVLVAGNPVEHVESFKQSGVDDFIHIRSNNQAKLEELLAKIGAF